MPGPTKEIELHFEPLGAWRLWTASPSSSLGEHVKEYWEVRGDLQPFREMVLPNAHVEVMLNLGPPHTVLSAQGEGVWDRAWFSGLQTHAIRIESLNGTHLVSIRMHPLGAAELFGSAVPAASERVIDLHDVIGADANDLHASLKGAASATERFALLEAFLVARRTHEVPAFVWSAARAIEASHGKAPVATLHEALGVSRKHLAVTFRQNMGLTAKAYAQIHRFMWTVAQLGQSKTVEWSTLAAGAGYSDQSHLARDFKRIGAATPREYLQRQTPGGDALID